MNLHAATQTAAPLLLKSDSSTPAFVVKGPNAISIRAGVTFSTYVYAEETPISLPDGGLEIGGDYGIVIDITGAPSAQRMIGGESPQPSYVGGFHYAPGGNAVARAGGDTTPVINSFSVWDRNFRPACPDPRGMALVDAPSGRFWCDIYLLSCNHRLTGRTSEFGATIADGNDRPTGPDGKKVKAFDYPTAVNVLALYDKQLLSLEEFFAAAYGVTEKTACSGDPETTGLDAPRTSKYGLMQATGNMWIWGHDGDPDEPRSSIFGGSWWNDDSAGSRFARVGGWPGYSSESLGARGRSDHLQLG